MPFTDGFDLTLKLQEIFQKYQIEQSEWPSIIALTSLVETDHLKKAFSVGISQIHSKPIDKNCIADILLENNFKF
jgi:CheY-like chemotaxis protein